MRGKAPPLHNSTAVDCREQVPCRLVLEHPFWQNWYFILVEKLLPLPDRIGFQLVVQLKGELAHKRWGSWGGKHQLHASSDT